MSNESDETPRLKLAQLVSMQEMNDVTWNEALAQLDALVDLCLLGQYVNAPPANPADGDAYLIGGAPTDAWAGCAYKIASCLDGSWRFYTPFSGLRAFVAPTNALIVYLNGNWVDWNSLISSAETSIASAATTDLGAAGSLFVQITGTTTITSFGTGADKLRYVRFAQSLTLTHNAASLILLGGTSRLTAPGDVGVYASDGSGNWRERDYARAAMDPGDAATKSSAQTLSNKTFSGATDFPGGTVIDSGGKLGIGMTPATQLDVTGTLRSYSEAAALGTWNVGVISARTANDSCLYFGYRTTPDAWVIGVTYGSTGAYKPLVIATHDTGRVVFDTDGSFRPYADNAYNLGSGSYRFGTVYAGTGTINTSGAADKAGTRALSEAELAVAKALAANARIFRFVDAVARKGDAARLHCGAIYEDVVAAFAAEGLDPLRYGIVCRDPVFKKTAVTTVEKIPVMKTVQIPVESFASVGGKSVLTVTMRDGQVQDCCDEPVVDAAGNPVLGADGSQRINCVPKYSDGPSVTTYFDTTEQDVDDEGNPKWIFALRYDELAQFVLAGLAARIAALEAE